VATVGEGLGDRASTTAAHLIITRPTQLQGRTVYRLDLRAGAALAALAATGRSEIHDVELVERGYENLVDRLAALGARIEKAC
jgi:UDP-N-acetylglucosamine 1-carboxyvinyltransferase